MKKGHSQLSLLALYFLSYPQLCWPSVVSDPSGVGRRGGERSEAGEILLDWDCCKLVALVPIALVHVPSWLCHGLLLWGVLKSSVSPSKSNLSPPSTCFCPRWLTGIDSIRGLLHLLSSAWVWPMGSTGRRLGRGRRERWGPLLFWSSSC